MNPIQKLWLQILSPFAYVINEKLAKRSGFFGKIGKFFIIGPREYGVHPINKAFIFLNRKYMFASAVLLHRYSLLKTLTHKGYHMMRPFKHVTYFGPLAVFVGLLRFIYHGQFTRGYEPDRLSHLSRRMGGKMGLPLNSLNQRTSSHYIEINYIYTAEMLKRYHRVHQKIIDERNRTAGDVKLTKYADPSYKFEAMKFIPMPALPFPFN